jgi:F0F1-type ATP synthase membrane subunit b/b'
MKMSLFAVLIFISAAAFASGAEHGGDEGGIPLGKIGIQFLNLGILLTALIYFVRKSIIAVFAQRQVSYYEQSVKTAAALKLAEAELADIKHKLSTLESTEAESLKKAQVEAEKTRKQIIEDAGAQAEKLKSDVSLVIGAEVYKAKNEIRNEIIEKSIATAKESVRASAQLITERSEKGFVSDLGQVKA